MTAAIRAEWRNGLNLLLLAACVAAPASAALPYRGVNLAGAEFGETSLPGNYNQHYIYPLASEVDYFMSKGMNTFRLPFRWERLQRSQQSELDPTELSRMNAFVEYATQQGAYVILDPHNFARYYPDVGNVQSSATGLIGSAGVPNASFADFWSRVADLYGENERVIFNLMNEPNTMPTEQWVSAANDAIVAIRNTGAENLILVPGNAWTGAWTWHQNWYGTPNAQAMTAIVDPGNNFAFDAHQYLNSNGSGASPTIVSATIGSERLTAFTNWARSQGARAFLGEFAVAREMIGDAPQQIGDEAIHDLLDYVEANDDVWLGWTWWAAGPWWGEYMFTLKPTSGGVDRPQMAVLQPHLVTCDLNGDGSVDAADAGLLFSQWGATPGSAADKNRDGLVDAADAGLLFAEWTGDTSTVPEPATPIALFGSLFGLWILGRRRLGVGPNLSRRYCPRPNTAETPLDAQWPQQPFRRP